MTGSKNIYFLSASDRINYGDLLFPLIFKTFAEQKGYRFYNYGIVESDLSHFGALPTHSYKQLLRKIKTGEGKLIIGGGEVFFGNWRTLYSFINPLYANFLKKDWYFKIEKKLNFAKFYLSSNAVSIPFCPSKKELKTPSINIYYNSVGGSFPHGQNKNEIKIIKQALSEATIVSVRDNRTRNALQRLLIEPKVVPDSALLMSEIYSEEEISNKVTFDPFQFKEDYIFLQLGINKGPKNLELFAKDIKKISKSLNLKIVLCPIGKAPGHEDNVILKTLRDFNNEFYYMEPNNVFDIMYLISKASLYMGTSLHGVITAQSFQTPFVGLNDKLIKVNEYTKTWLGEQYRSLSFTEIGKVIDIYREWDSNYIGTKTIEQKTLVKNNINSFFDE